MGSRTILPSSNLHRRLDTPLPVSYYPVSSYATGFSLSKGNMVGVVSLPASYTLSFDLMPTADGTTWRSIVLLTATGVPSAQFGAANDGHSSCSQYCYGYGGLMCNNEFPKDWNGGTCVAAGLTYDLTCSHIGADPRTPGILPCLCQASPATPWNPASAWTSSPASSIGGLASNDPGSRLPAIMFCGSYPGGSCPGRGLHLAYTGTASTYSLSHNQVELSTTQDLPLDLWSTVTVTVDSIKLIMTLTVSGGVTIPTMSVALPKPALQVWPSIQVYASDPWYDSAGAKIRNLAVSSLAPTFNPTAVPTSHPSPKPSAEPTSRPTVVPTQPPTAAPTFGQGTILDTFSLCDFYNDQAPRLSLTASSIFSNWKCGHGQSSLPCSLDDNCVNSNWGNVTVKLISGQIRVTKLEMGLKGFSGTLSSSLGNLDALVELSINNNEFSGSLPSELGKLTNLFLLRLDSNNFTSRIPSSLCNLSHSIQLRMAENHFACRPACLKTPPFSYVIKDSNLAVCGSSRETSTDSGTQSLSDLIQNFVMSHASLLAYMVALVLGMTAGLCVAFLRHIACRDFNLVPLSSFDITFGITMAVLQVVATISEVADASPQSHSNVALVCIALVRLIMASVTMSVVFRALYRVSLQRHIVGACFHNATVWVAIAALALLDPSILRFFCWKHGEFAKRS